MTYQEFKDSFKIIKKTENYQERLYINGTLLSFKDKYFVNCINTSQPKVFDVIEDAIKFMYEAYLIQIKLGLNREVWWVNNV